MQAGLPYSHPPHPHSSINQTAAAAAAMNPYAASSSLLASQVKISSTSLIDKKYIIIIAHQIGLVQ